MRGQGGLGEPASGRATGSRAVQPQGSTPAQTGRAWSSSSSSGGPSATLADASLMGSERTSVPFSSSGRRARTYLPASLDEMLGKGVQGSQLLVRVSNELGRAEDDGGSIVHGMVKGRAGQNQPIHDGDRGRRLRGSLFQGLEHPACGRSVNIKRIAQANVDGRNHEGCITNPRWHSIALSRIEWMASRS